jgi:2-desacetyl-2-hydroxyethyl bacteriochlorophyllide A dehydrogenase
MNIAKSTLQEKAMHNPTIVFQKPGLVALEEYALEEPAAGAVRIRSEVSLISTGTEMSIFGGEAQPGSAWAQAYPFPVVPGYNNVGVVEAVGTGVDDRWLGKKVATMGKHAARVVVPVEGLYEIPPGIETDDAVFFTIAEIVMNGVRRSKLTWGDAAVVYGAGLLGQFTARFCALVGADVFVVDSSDYRLSRLPSRGFTGLNPQKVSVAEAVRKSTGGRMADVVFEVTGAADLIPSEFAVLREEGRMVMLSSPRAATTFDFHDYCNRGSYTIIGSHNMSHPKHASPDNPWTIARHVTFFFELLEAGRLDLGPLKSHSIPFDEAPGMYRSLKEDRAETMGILIRWGDA